MRMPLVTRVGAELSHCIAFFDPSQPEVVDGWHLPREMQNARFSTDLMAFDRKAGRGQTERRRGIRRKRRFSAFRSRSTCCIGGPVGSCAHRRRPGQADASGWGKISPPVRRPGGSTAQ